MKLSDLTAKTKPVSFDYDGEPVHLEVRSQLVTPKLVADLDALQDNAIGTATRMRSVSEMLARLVGKWDVLEDDGAMFPLDVKRLVAEIPLEFQMRCLMAAIQAMNPAGEASAPAA